MPPFSFIPSGESRELEDDIRELFADLAATLARHHRAFTGECHPALDVRETDEALEVVVDVSGVPREALRVLFRGGVLLIAGEKAPATTTELQTYHLVEREFGRFARAVRVDGAFDAQRATAEVRNGELAIVLPKISERRGQPLRIRVGGPDDRPAMKLLFIGDIVGKPGREMVRKGVRPLVDRFDIDLVIANAENAAAGFGVTKDIGDTLLEYGVHVMTSGNHIWAKKEVIPYITAEPRLLRPANFPPGTPGRGSYLAQTGDGRAVGVINVMGRVFMQPLDDPFSIVLKEIEALRGRTKIILVDFHGEATSEKVAMGWHLDGKVTLVVGTHTHVQTADERILPNGTAYLTDAGMTGPHDSVIGMERDTSLARFVNGMPGQYEPATGNPRLNGVIVEADDKTGRAVAIRRVSVSERDLQTLSDGGDLPHQTAFQGTMP